MKYTAFNLGQYLEYHAFCLDLVGGYVRILHVNHIKHAKVYLLIMSYHHVRSCAMQHMSRHYNSLFFTKKCR